MAATLYLAGSIFILLVAASSWFQARRIGPLVPVYFLTGWLAGELALQVVAVGVAITLGFARARRVRGAARRQSGSRSRSLAWGLLLASYLRSHGARREIDELARESGLAIDCGDVRAHARLPAPVPDEARRRARILHIPYGESLPGDKGGRNLLDVVLPDEPGADRPILRPDPRRRLDDRRQARAGRAADGLPREPRLGVLRDQLPALAEGRRSPRTSST